MSGGDCFIACHLDGSSCERCGTSTGDEGSVFPGTGRRNYSAAARE